MSFTIPAILLLIIPVIAYSLYLKKSISRFQRIGKTVLLALIIIAASGPLIELNRGDASLIVIADRSNSMGTNALLSQEETIAKIAQKSPAHGKMAVITYAENAAIDFPLSKPAFKAIQNSHVGDASDLNTAISAALSIIPQNDRGRILLLTDGRWTNKNPLSDSVKTAVKRGIPIFHKAITRETLRDTAITTLNAPISLQKGEAMVSTVAIESPIAQKIEWRLKRNGTIISKGTHALENGQTILTFRDLDPIENSNHYDLTIYPSTKDPTPENNTISFHVTASGSKPILVIPSVKKSPLADNLMANGAKAIVKEPRDISFSLEELSKYSAIVVENRPASDIGLKAMQNIVTFVEELGGAFFLSGGKNSFGMGGYYKSPIETILPVSLEVRNEKRKFNIAICIALDRSGSMSIDVGPGIKKMDLANKGTAEILNILKDDDQIAVFACDTKAHEIIPLTNAKSARNDVGKILRINSEGGGIFVYEALLNALKELEKSQASIRHLLLFADAADSEEPGDYQNLLTYATKAGITISVIGLGTEKDIHADLLKDIADWGQGSAIFNSNARELPRLFAQDAISVAGSALATNQTTIAFTEAITQLSNVLGKTTPTLSGYNITFDNQNGHTLAYSTDEKHSPILAIRSVGLGRTIAYTGELNGELSGTLPIWNDIGEFYSAISRYLTGKGEDDTEGFFFESKTVPGGLKITAYAQETDNVALSSEGLRYKIVKAKQGEKTEVVQGTLEWDSSAEQSAIIPIIGSETLLPIITLPSGRTIRLPLAKRPYSPEYSIPSYEKSDSFLKEVAVRTGGRQLPDPTKVWDRMKQNKQKIDLSPYLYLLSGIILLLLVIERRLSIFSKQPSQINNSAVSTTEKQKASSLLTNTPPNAPDNPSSTPNILRQVKKQSFKRFQR